MRRPRIVNALQEWRNPLKISVLPTEIRKPRIYSLLPRLYQEVLEIEQSLLWRVHVHERGRNTSLPATTCTPDLMHVVFDLLWHREDNDVLDIIEVQPFGCDARCDDDILGARLERFDGVLPFFLG